MKMGRRALVLEANVHSLLCASCSPAEHGCLKPLGEGGLEALQLYIKGAH